MAVVIALLIPRIKPSSSPSEATSAALRTEIVAQSVPWSSGVPQGLPSGRVVRRAAVLRTANNVRQVTTLPKLDVFPTPAKVDLFPRPVKPSEGEIELMGKNSAKPEEALAALKLKQSMPIRIAAIEIAPLQTNEDKVQNR
jgi:hypothetical protein